MEFLVTYGWVFITIMVVMGAIIYLGVLDPSRFMKPYCDFSYKLQCKDFAITKNGSSGPGGSGFIVRLQNNFERPIAVYSITSQNVNINQCNCKDCIIGAGGRFEIFLGQTRTFYCDLNNKFAKKDRQKIIVNVEWARNATENTPRHSIVGTISSKVCDGAIVVNGNDVKATC